MGLMNSIATLLGHGDGQERLRHHMDLLTSLLVMAWMVEARDPYTGGHLWRVSRFCQLLATAAGLPAADVARVTVGGFLHDLGKVGVPDHILGKKDRLTDAEYEVIKNHPEAGWRLLAGHPLAILAEAAVRCHHETPDGRGYPRGLRGMAVPTDARIVGICDAFDAMTSTRPYRRGMPVARALEIIEENLDRQFDPALGRRFVDMGRAGLLDHVVGHSDEGIPLHECVMCGPTLVVRRDQGAGQRIHCPSCTGEYLLQERPEGGLVATATGRQGSPRDLQPEADTALIVNVVRESARALLA